MGKGKSYICDDIRALYKENTRSFFDFCQKEFRTTSDTYMDLFEVSRLRLFFLSRSVKDQVNEQTEANGVE